MNGNEIRPAPNTKLGILRNIGPGMILAGSIVGSGELIATTRTGAEAGFDFLWLIIFGCIIKVFTQIELGRHAISSGKTTLATLNEVPGPRVLNGNWIIWYWFLLFIAIVAQQGGIVGGVGQAMSISIPLTEKGQKYNEYVQTKVQLEVAQAERDNRADSDARRLAKLDEKIITLTAAVQTAEQNGLAKPENRPLGDKYWAGILTLIAIFLLVWGNFSFIERFCIFLVVTFTLVTIVNLFALQTHDAWAVSVADIVRGMSFHIPEPTAELKPLATALATFGIIGVGGAELITYPYWCLEKGYGKWIGPRDNSNSWLGRARGWLRVMQWDAWGAMVVYTFCTIAFYLLGAAILHRSGLLPEKSELIQTLSAMYAPVFGAAAQGIFLFGAFAVLFSTFYVALAAQSRLAADAINVLGLAKLNDIQKKKVVKGLGVALPAIAVTIYTFFPAPTWLILTAGTMQAILLPMLGFSVLYFRYKKSDPRLRAGKLWDIMLWLSFFAFLVIGAHLAYTKLFT
ncbi:MAG: Nramp family divalent metal transporter [Verrucomicrobiota bacterium]|nr:Nramp family divalent metal transporter [Verrucomicrobiota bacterium]MDP7049210.1 Nramp family divalent metal transporter [Verrucomicrobiota bacterium]